MNNDKDTYQRIKQLIIEEKINIEDLSEKELDALIDYETDIIINSTTEPDMSFLNICYDALRKFKDYGNIISDEKCRELSDKAYIEFAQKKICTAHIKNKFAKRFATVCAAMLIFCFMSLSVAAISLGSYTSAWEYVSQNVSDLLNFSGTKDYNNITILKEGVSTRYKSVHEFLADENIDILYPAVLPNGIYVEKLVVKNVTDTRIILFDLSNDNVSFKITNSYVSDFSLYPVKALYTANGIDFYIITINNVFQAMAQYDGMEYSLACESYEELIFIIDNLKMS